MVAGRWRIIETEVWDTDALDMVVPAHLTLDRRGVGEVRLVAIDASVDYRVTDDGGRVVVEFSWSGFDDMEPTSGRARATVSGDEMHGTLFIHHGDESTFSAKRRARRKVAVARPGRKVH